MSNIIFKDYPEFKPSVHPINIVTQFGGTYFRPIPSYDGKSIIKDDYKKYSKLFRGIDPKLYTRPCDEYNVEQNKYKVKVGFDVDNECGLYAWREKGWITADSSYPRGWFEWYCAFTLGKRSKEDQRQINRWIGVRNRFFKRLKKLISEGKDSMKLRQILLHWAIDTDNI